MNSPTTRAIFKDQSSHTICDILCHYLPESGLLHGHCRASFKFNRGDYKRTFVFSGMFDNGLKHGRWAVYNIDDSSSDSGTNSVLEDEEKFDHGMPTIRVDRIKTRTPPLKIDEEGDDLGNVAIQDGGLCDLSHCGDYTELFDVRWTYPNPLAYNTKRQDIVFAEFVDYEKGQVV